MHPVNKNGTRLARPGAINRFGILIIRVSGFTKGVLPFAPSGSNFGPLRSINFVPDKIVKLQPLPSEDSDKFN